MKIEKIKPIPKYMVETIKKLDKKTHPEQDGHARYYAYLTKNEGELCKVFVAVKCHKGSWYCKQCIVHGIHSDVVFVKDTKFQYMSGYVTGFYDLGIGKYQEWYEDGLWYENSFFFNPWALTVNKEYISKFPEYRYSAYELYEGDDVFSYVKQYEKFPQMEFFIKMGLSYYTYSVQMLKKAEKDKSFRKWLYRNSEELKQYRFDIAAIMRAYKKNMLLEESQSIESLRKQKELRPILELHGDNFGRYLKYVKKQGIEHRLYCDYLKACNYLGIDMSVNKNRFPHEFMKWHDVRINEADSKRGKEDRKMRREFYKTFAGIAEKYRPLERVGEDAFTMLIAKSPAELCKEGEKLNHCVGKQGYDQKFVREESLIFFLRMHDFPDKPYVTVEYSPEQKKVLQCYAAHNQTPSEDAREYVNAVWLPYANKTLKKIMKQRKVRKYASA